MNSTEEYISLLSKYVNGGVLSRFDKMICVFGPAILLRKNAAKMQQAVVASDRPSKSITISPYAGTNEHVLSMREYLARHLEADLAAAFVHGSLGTYEEIPYSDFDGLVIIRDEVFRDTGRLADVAKKLYDARKIMLECDPLQHHGWFVLNENSLLDYPEAYFPLVLLEHAKSILHEGEATIRIQPGDNADFRKPFFNLCNSLDRKLDGYQLPGNIYEVKNLLSEFMLLPAFYVQARDKMGVFKKQSFDLARKDFTAEQWKAMDDISFLRNNWKVEISEADRKKLLQNISAKRTFLSTRSIPSEIRLALNPEMLKKMEILVNEAKSKIR
jgi:hypothetical protein